MTYKTCSEFNRWELCHNLGRILMSKNHYRQLINQKIQTNLCKYHHNFRKVLIVRPQKFPIWPVDKWKDMAQLNLVWMHIQHCKKHIKELMHKNKKLCPHISTIEQSWSWTTLASIKSPFMGKQLNQAGTTCQIPHKWRRQQTNKVNNGRIEWDKLMKYK